MPLSIAILGSTGSIGVQVLDVARRLGPEVVRVRGLAAQRNAAELIKQALEFRPDAVCIGDEKRQAEVASALGGAGIDVLGGHAGLDELAARDGTDRIVVSVAGTPGLSPTLSAIESGKDVALASKEVLVAAGHLIMEAAARKEATILPIDSEHSAIFQCLKGEDSRQVERIFLTASGGPFRDLPKDKLAFVTPQEALDHPTWKMGRKVTVDSASLMNKGLEVIEARWLFGVPPERIEVVLHPQSIVHSMVRFCDGSTLAQLGLPDMRLPIQHALLYPQRVDLGLPRYDPIESGPLAFEPVDLGRYDCLRVALEAARVGGTLCAAMNAADEIAVELFLQGRIGFLDIGAIVGETMRRHAPRQSPTIEEIYAVDAEARHIALELAVGG